MIEETCFSDHCWQAGFYVAFDLLFLDGVDVRRRPWSGRREQLEG
jgi:ATP-dependent DNA ligase